MVEQTRDRSVAAIPHNYQPDLPRAEPQSLVDLVHFREGMNPVAEWATGESESISLHE